MRRFAHFAYALVAYSLTLATILYLVGFFANLVPLSIDAGGVPGGAGALVLNLALVALFGLQHSVMARPGFKRVWTRVVPEPIERASYCIASCAALALLFAAWRPVPFAIWDVEAPAARAALWALYGGGWALVLASTFQLGHFDLFGLRQVVLPLIGRAYGPLPFRVPFLYGFVRHPLYVGWLLVMWATPSMTLGHLAFAAATTAYILIAIRYEERDLEQALGDDYRRWRRTTPSLIPLPRPSRRIPRAQQPAA